MTFPRRSVRTHVKGLNMAFPTRNSAVPVGVAIGVALVVALDNILFGVGVGVACDGGHGQLPSSEIR